MIDVLLKPSDKGWAVYVPRDNEDKLACYFVKVKETYFIKPTAFNPTNEETEAIHERYEKLIKEFS